MTAYEPISSQERLTTLDVLRGTALLGIATSVICVLIFYSPGLALMGRLQRYQLYFVVFGAWIFNLAWSRVWLSRYRFGPLEWCWRSLTYWQRQPMRRPVATPEESLAVS